MFAHMLTFRSVDAFEYVPNLREAVSAVKLAFIPFVCVLVFDRDLLGSKGWIRDVSKFGLVLGIILVVYSVWFGIEVGGWCFFAKGCGGITESSNFYGPNLAIQALHTDRVKATQLLTGKYLLLFGLPALYFLFRQRPIHFGMPWKRD